MPELTKIGLITFGESAAIALARAGGLFEAQGLEVEVTRTPSSTEQMRGLIQDRWQIASTAFDNVLAWSEREGPEVVAVAKASAGVNLPVYVRPEIQTWDDLRGKALAVDAVDTAYGLVLRRMLQEHGLELDRDYTFVPAGATGYRLESMEKGETFAGVLNPPWNARAEEAGMRLIARHSDVVPGYPGGVFAVSRPWGEANRGIVVGFLRALLDAARWAADPSRQNAAASLIASASDITEERAARTLNDVPDLRPEPETFAIPLEIRLRFNLTPPHGPDIAAYLDHSYLEEAQA
ncbi:MAG: ABC transporter substrate-binding protein [Chloroflexi bacterium]|nr:ABC transporter substrate-binding protein [Chloroflexota bacterium]